MVHEAIHEWRVIPGLTPYEVSNFGEVRNSATGQAVKLRHNQYGYKTIYIKVNGIFKTFMAHRLVLFAFVGEPPTTQHECAHYDGVRDNNFIGNLRWATAKENCADKIRHGTHFFGEGCPNSILTVEQVKEIMLSDETAKSLAQRFRVSPRTISSIKTGRSWRNVKPFKFWIKNEANFCFKDRTFYSSPHN